MLQVASFALLMAAAIVFWSNRVSARVAILLSLLPYLTVALSYLLTPRMPGYDSLDFHLPIFHYIGAALAEGPSFPEWLPIGGGIRIGFLQIPMIYFTPHRLLGYAMDAWTPLTAVTAFKLQSLFGMALLGLGWWLFLEKVTESRLAASFGTVALVLGGTGITVHQEQVLGTSYLVPWFLLAVRQLGRGRPPILALALMCGLASSLHYPHILLLSLVVVSLVAALFGPRATIARIRPALGPVAIPALALFAVGLAPLIYVTAALPELASPIRAASGAPMFATSYPDYLDKLIGSGSSATPAYLRHYLVPDMPGPHPDYAAFFVGRLALLMGLAALVLAPRRSIPVAIMAAIFALLALGIEAPVPLVEALFTLWPGLVGSFRQWFHFFPMLNFCLSALAAIGLAALIPRLRDRVGRAAPLLLLGLFALQLLDLTDHARKYLEAYTVVERPVDLIALVREKEPRWGIASRYTLLTYAERAEADRCCRPALARAPYLTGRADIIDAAARRRPAALAERLSESPDLTIVEAPPDAASSLQSRSGPPLEVRRLDMTYRPDGADFEVVVNRPALLVMPLNHALGLAAEIDGEPVPVWRANLALSVVLVPPGGSRVELRVRPDSYRWIAVSQVICVAALFTLLGAMLARRGDAEES